jgi:hypothetical protein
MSYRAQFPTIPNPSKTKALYVEGLVVPPCRDLPMVEEDFPVFEEWAELVNLPLGEFFEGIIYRTDESNHIASVSNASQNPPRIASYVPPNFPIPILKQLPESIGNLKNLTNFGWTSNPVTLPTSFWTLPLKSLSLWGNQLADFPLQKGQFPHLQSLQLGKNKLTSLPDSICSLSELTNLYVSHNQLTLLPEALGNLPALKKLEFDHNRITRLPASLANLYDNMKQIPGDHDPNHWNKVSLKWDHNCLPSWFDTTSSYLDVFAAVQKDLLQLAQDLIREDSLCTEDETWLTRLCTREILLYLEESLDSNHPLLYKIRLMHSIPTDVGPYIL